MKEGIRHFLDTGASLSKMSRRELEEAARALVRGATPTKERIDDAVDELRAHSRRSADFVTELLHNDRRADVDAVTRRGREQLADLLERAADVFSEFVSGDRRRGSADDRAPAAEEPPAETPAEGVAVKKAPAKKGTAKRTAGKKAPAKRTAATEAPAKESPAKESPAKKSPAKRAAATGAPAKKAPAKKAPAKKVSATKASPKKAAARKAPGKKAAAAPQPPTPSQGNSVS